MKLSNDIAASNGSCADRSALDEVARRYAVAITPAMSALIDPHAVDDPIARQFTPDSRELDADSAARPDPIGDGLHEAVPGLIHRYPDRVLVKVVQVCAVYCRFCFRREMIGPGTGAPLSEPALSQVMDYIRRHREVWEVILSGGDPLVLSPRRIGEITAELARVEHVKVVRWHSRLPAVAPERITSAMVDALRHQGVATWVALHANHPRELTPQARAACARIIDAGIPMVSQTVLLKGVNDDPATLDALMRAFVETRIKPYYLHHLDLAPGTRHFRVSLTEGQTLMRELRRSSSGLCQPLLVLDIPDGYGKVPVGPDYVERTTEGTFEVKDPNGRAHPYCDGAVTSAPLTPGRHHNTG